MATEEWVCLDEDIWDDQLNDDFIWLPADVSGGIGRWVASGECFQYTAIKEPFEYVANKEYFQYNADRSN